MAAAMPPWFYMVFSFTNMLIAIVLLVLVLFVIVLKLGPTGRFFLDLNLLPGPKEIALIKSHTNALKFFRVKSNGRALRIKKDRYMFLPDLRRATKNKDGNIKLDPKAEEFNDLLMKPSHLDGKIVHMGSASVSVAGNPSIMEALAVGRAGPEEVKAFFKSLQTYARKSAKLTISKIHILTEFQIQDLAKIMNIVITPQRLAMVFREGELKGMARHKLKETVLLGVILILCLTIVGLSFLMTKK